MTSPDADLPEQDVPPATTERVTHVESVTTQRTPRYARLMVAGAVIVALVAVVVTLSFDEQETAPRMEVLGMMIIVGAAVGAGIGALVALALGRAARRHTRTVSMERLTGTEAERGAEAEQGSEADQGSAEHGEADHGTDADHRDNVDRDERAKGDRNESAG